MGAKIGTPEVAGLDAVVDRVSKRTGQMPVSGRYHTPPRRIEQDYKVLSTVLGSGYNGRVFLAVHRQTGRKCAVKGFKLTGVSAEIKEDLESEVEIFLQVDHPHIVRLSEVYETPEMLYLVMECMTGGELYKRVVRRKRFSEKDACESAYQMLLAINYIHGQNIVHRDIKLENFLYESEDSDHLKLIDFGFGKIWQPNTKLKMSCGTLAYVAPEVLNKSYGSQCDMWSFGVSVFVTLFGHVPFCGTETEQIRSIQRGSYTKNSRLWSKVSPQAQDFIASLLVVDPKARMTAKQALAHEWMAQRERMALVQSNVDMDIFASLIAFSQASAFRRACMSMMAWSLSNEDRKEVRDAFLELDTDRSGTITLGEFRRALEDRFHITDERVLEVFNALDTNQNEQIHYSDFLAAMVSSRLQMHDDLLMTTFKRFDKDNTGKITGKNLMELLDEVHAPEDAHKMLAEADVGSDAEITYAEFLGYLRDGETAQEFREVALEIIDNELRQKSHRRMPTMRSRHKTTKSALNIPSRAKCCCCMQ